MAIKVCDAIMGTGKSQSAIAYMNKHKDCKFIYITPYLDEAARIKQGCPDLKFVEPSNKIKQYGHRKLEHTAYLIKLGKNIATTHQSFKWYTEDMLEDIRNNGYTLIIDENVDILERFEYHEDDIDLAVKSGYITETDGVYTRSDKEYHGKVLLELFDFIKSKGLIRIDDGQQGSLFYWALPPDLITSFKDVFILTYLFRGQSLHHLLHMHNIPYEYIGIQRTKGGTGFEFADYPGYTPEYVKNLKNMIHIMDNEKLNAVGDDYYALSMSWFSKDVRGVSKLKNNAGNYFKNIWSDVSLSERLWSTYKSEYGRMRGKGYTNSFLTFNTKATNAYRDKTHLIYMVNVFMNVGERIFYEKHGIEVDEDMFALSIMVQWIWRSAIRDGEEIYIYIPSSRMRNILTNWIETVSKGGNFVE
jgi:hypothetical protein